MQHSASASAPNGGFSHFSARRPKKGPDTRKQYEVIANTSFGSTKTIIRAVNPRQAAAIGRNMLKQANPVIKSVKLVTALN